MVDLQRGHRPFPFRRVPLFSIGALLVSLTACSGDAESTGPAADPVLLVQVTGSGSVNVNQGQVVVNDAQSQASASFATGTVVTLAAEPDPGWRLRSWSGSCSGSATTCSVTMMADRTVSAEFEEIEEVGSGSLGSGGGRIVTVEGTASIQIPPEFMEGAATVAVAESEPEDGAWNTPLSGTGYLFTVDGSAGLDALDPDQDFTIRMRIDTQLPAGDEVAVRVEFPEAPGVRMFATGEVSADGSEVEVILASGNLLALMSWFESSAVRFRLIPEKFEPEPPGAAPSPQMIPRSPSASFSAANALSSVPAGCYDYPLDRISPSSLGADSRIAVVLVHGWNPDVGNCDHFENVQVDAGPRRWGFHYWDQVYEAVSDELRGIPFFTFTYPSFVDWEESGAYLAERLTELRVSGEFDGVILLGHSMGGLLSADAARRVGTRGFIQAVITLATPYEGSPLAILDDDRINDGLETAGSRSLQPGRLPADLPSSVFEVPFIANAGTLYEGDQACLILAYRRPRESREECQSFRPGFPRFHKYRLSAEFLCAVFGECINDGTVGLASQLGASVDFVTPSGQFPYSHTEMRFGELELRDPADPLFKALIEDIRTYLPARTLTVRRVGNGTVTAQPGTLTFPPGEDVAQMEGAQGARIVLGASAAPGWSFERWDGVYCVAPTGCVVELNSDLEVTALFVQDGDAPRITTMSLPDGTAGASYSQQLQASGGSMPYTWSLETGSLPTGLSLSTGGAISGAPASAGTSTFTVRVTGGDGLSSTSPLSLAVQSSGPPSDEGIVSTSTDDIVYSRNGAAVWRHEVEGATRIGRGFVDAGVLYVGIMPTSEILLFDLETQTEIRRVGVPLIDGASDGVGDVQRINANLIAVMGANQIPGGGTYLMVLDESQEYSVVWLRRTVVTHGRVQADDDYVYVRTSSAVLIYDAFTGVLERSVSIDGSSLGGGIWRSHDAVSAGRFITITGSVRDFDVVVINTRDGSTVCRTDPVTDYEWSSPSLTVHEDAIFVKTSADVSQSVIREFDRETCAFRDATAVHAISAFNAFNIAVSSRSIAFTSTQGEASNIYTLNRDRALRWWTQLPWGAPLSPSGAFWYLYLVPDPT